MIKIEFGNVTAKIHGLDEYPILKQQLLKVNSWEEGGFGAPKVTKTIMSSKTNMLYTGVIPYVIKYAKQYNIPYTLEDRRQQPTSGDYYELAEGIQLRDYQLQVINNVGPRSIIGAATGAGKTVIMAALIAHVNVKKAVIVSPELALAYQTQQEISKFLGIHVGILSGQDYDMADVMVVTPEAALKNKVILENAEHILYDECQFLGANTIFNTARLAKNAYYRYALSATPWRDGNDSIKIYAAINVPNPKTYITASALIQKGKLSPVDIFFIEQEDVCGWQGNYHATYNKQIVHNISRNEKIIKAIKMSNDNNWGSVLVLLSRIEHGTTLLNKIRTTFQTKNFHYTYKDNDFVLNEAEYIHGGTELIRRNAILQAVRDKKVKYVIGSQIFDAGISCNTLSVLILAGSGKSSTRAFQRIGRVLRLSEGKTRARVFDFMDYNNTFYKHSLTRKCLYATEEEYRRNMYLMNSSLQVIKRL